MRVATVADPGNLYGVDYMWLIATGMSFDCAKILTQLAAGPLNSWRLLLDPHIV